MTATPGPSDAELVTRVLAGDREAFAIVYDRYGPRLYDFAYSMLRHREDASDAVADSFVLFAQRLGQLRDPDRLRPWLYAVVRSECLRRLKARKRVSYGDDEALAAMPDDSLTPDQAAEKAALTQLVWDAAAGLADRDRALLDLHLRQGLEGAELGEAMGTSASNAYVMLNRLRGQVDRSLGALLIARLGREDCAELDALLGGWDGSFSPLIRKRVARHVESCETCGERRRTMLSPWVLLAGVPVFVAPLTLRDRVLGDSRLVSALGPLDGGPPAGPLGAAAAGPSRAPRGRKVLAAVAAAAVLVAGGLALHHAQDDKATDASSGLRPGDVLGGGHASDPPRSPATSAPSTAPAPLPTFAPPPAPPTPASTTVAPAGVLAASTSRLDFGARAGRRTFRLSNTGGQPISFLIGTTSGAVSASPASRIIAPGSSVVVTVAVDRSRLAEGSATEGLSVSSGGGAADVQVLVDTERNPVIGRPSVGASSCDVPVTAKVTDESRLTSVRLSWSGPGGSGSAAMSAGANGWAATPRFTVGGQVTFRVTATDSRGNSATGPVLRTQIDPCPG
ncbi:MAG: sigma-70 family RNA polymerase sigma factor [Marmoricola sp.]